MPPAEAEGLDGPVGSDLQSDLRSPQIEGTP